MSDVAVQAPEAPEQGNSFSRIFGAIFSPKATFESIARRPTWLLPLLVLCVLSACTIVIFGHRGGWPSYLDRQLANNSRFQEMPRDQQQQVIETQLKITSKVTPVITAVVPIIAALIIAAVLLGVFNGLAGAEIKFKNSLAVIAYSYSPGIISGLLALLIVSFKDVTTIDLQNIVASSGAAFLPSGSPRWMVALLGSLDLFSFWYMILMAIGYSAASPRKLSAGKAFAWIFGIWLAYVLVKVGLTAAFS